MHHHKVRKKIAHDSQIVRAKENLKLSHGWPSQRQASGTNQQMKALRPGHHRVLKVETITINYDWVYNQASRLSYDINVVSYLFATVNYRFILITKINLSNNSFEFIN